MSEEKVLSNDKSFDTVKHMKTEEAMKFYKLINLDTEQNQTTFFLPYMGFIPGSVKLSKLKHWETVSSSSEPIKTNE